MTKPPDESQESRASTPDSSPTSSGLDIQASGSTGDFSLTAQTKNQQGHMIPTELLGHPRYLLREWVGAGAMGNVYKAVHIVMDRIVALKVIHPHLVENLAAVRRFRREVRAAAALSHPKIVAAYDADQAGSTHFLIMEFVEGSNLDEVAQEQGPLPVDRACDYARQAALGLQHAFERGMVHRDIKPHNLMLTPQGEIKILDFGLARFVSEVPQGRKESLAFELSESGGSTDLGMPAGAHSTRDSSPAATYGAAGTPDYMPPEEIQDPGSADIRGDIYSLGCTLYRFLTGRVPFPRDTNLEKLKGHLTEYPTPPEELRPDLPGQLVEILNKMMAKDPANRYQTPSEVARVLARFVAPSGRQILVVEDDGLTLEALARALEAEGFTAVRAANGREALDVIEGGLQPHLIVLDLTMPEMDGWEFLRETRRDPILLAIPVVIVSATHPDAAFGAALSAASYLVKPVQPSELAERVKSILGQGKSSSGVTPSTRENGA